MIIKGMKIGIIRYFIEFDECNNQVCIFSVNIPNCKYLYTSQQLKDNIITSWGKYRVLYQRALEYFPKG